MTEVRECVDQAIQLVTDAWENPNEAVHKLAEAEHMLHQALTHVGHSKNPARIQQLQDAKNAVEQALRSAGNSNQDRTQVNNAIDQAVSACKQIH